MNFYACQEGKSNLIMDWSVSEEVRSSVNRYSVSNDFQKSKIEKIKIRY